MTSSVIPNLIDKSKNYPRSLTVPMAISDAEYYQERRRAKEPWPCTSWLGPVVVFDVCRLDHTRTPKLPLGVIVQHGASPVERGEFAYPPRLSIADIPGSAALCRYCCKSPKLPDGACLPGRLRAGD